MSTTDPQLVAQRFDLGQFLGIGRSECLCLLNCLRELLLKLGFIGALVLTEFLLDLGQEIVFEELRDLRSLGAHDPVNAEVQIRLIELEQAPSRRVFSFAYFWLIAVSVT